eukprot:evm.model.scf_1111.2 EVM.evm.TU.scf_1111.2   scf_1111:38636-42354(-)
MARAATVAFVACLLATCLLADMVAAEQAAAEGFSLAQGSSAVTGYRKLLLLSSVFGGGEEEKGPREANTETGQRINNAIDKLSYGWRVIKFGYNVICLFAPCSPLRVSD